MRPKSVVRSPYILVLFLLSTILVSCQLNFSNQPDSTLASSQLGSSLNLEPTPDRGIEEQYTTADQPDDVDGYQIHFIYAIPSDGKDDHLDVNGKIALSAAAMNYWLESKTRHRLRYDTYNGELDISFMQLDATSEQIYALDTDILSLMEFEVKSRGFSSDHKLYVVHYDGFFVTQEGFCGLASYPPEGAGITAVLLLRGYNPKLDLTCPRQFTQSEDFTGYFEMTILHELLHLMGMVPSCSPHYADGHVSDSWQDLLYYQYDGSYSPLYTYLDLRNDDYYNHGDPECPDLARSIFLDPLPPNAELPPGWDISTTYMPADPLAGNK
jgi:hypothetical protein